jgi:hypothetical protein
MPEDPTRCVIQFQMAGRTLCPTQPAGAKADQDIFHYWAG